MSNKYDKSIILMFYLLKERACLRKKCFESFWHYNCPLAWCRGALLLAFSRTWEEGLNHHHQLIEIPSQLIK